MTDCSIIVLGSVNTDLVIRGPRLPSPGETVLGGRFYQSAGGKGANQAVAAARAGSGSVALIAAVGDDAFGRAALAHVAAERLVCDYVKVVPGRASGVALIMVDDRGENSISVASGANYELLPSDVDSIPDELFAASKIFLACLELPMESVARGLQRAKAAGLVTILNPAPATRDLVDAGLLKRVDIITPNETEAALLTGLSADDEAGASRAGRKLQALGCGVAVVTRGASGCTIIDRQVTTVPAIRVEAVDTTAAGDAFNGALAVALAEGRSLEEAIRWTTVAAGLSVTRPGAQPSLPSRAEIDATGPTS